LDWNLFKRIYDIHPQTEKLVSISGVGPATVRALSLIRAAVVLAGGFIGSKSGAFKFDHHKIIIIIAAVVAVAGIELTIKLLA
jgi:hypothetical protein